MMHKLSVVTFLIGIQYSAAVDDVKTQKTGKIGGELWGFQFMSKIRSLVKITSWYFDVVLSNKILKYEF